LYGLYIKLVKLSVTLICIDTQHSLPPVSYTAIQTILYGDIWITPVSNQVARKIHEALLWMDYSGEYTHPWKRRHRALERLAVPADENSN
jgi:hypothetical protein